MKERYEGRIKEIEEEKETLEGEKEELDELVPRLREEIKKLQSQGQAGDAGGGGDSQNLLAEVNSSHFITGLEGLGISCCFLFKIQHIGNNECIGHLKV